MAATTEALGRFSEEETIWAAAGVLRWIERYGVPQALYTDWKNVYVRPPNAEERASGGAAVMQFGRMCAKLGIRIISASSPQAKGRVERAHGTHQDRLVKKLRPAEIANYDPANAHLVKHYLAEHNRRYAYAAAPADYHRRRPTARQLDAVFWLEEERVVSEDWVVRYHDRLLQLDGKVGIGRQPRTVCWCGRTRWDKSRFTTSTKRVRFRELKASTALSEGRGAAPSPAPPSPNQHRPTPPTHPWRQGSQNMRTPTYSLAWH
jgi:hypothetical protein